MEILENKSWIAAHREPLQKYADYKFVIESANKSIKIITDNLNNPEKLKDSPKAGIMRGAKRRAEAGLESIIYGYSAGHPIVELSNLFPEVVNFWLASMEPQIQFESSTDNDGHRVPHLDLYGSQYWEALQLICFAILLGHSDKLAKIADLLIHENDDQDSLLEDLVAPYLLGRPVATVYTRQLPYRKTRKIFQADPEEQPTLMSQYLKEWYLASRREPFHDRHKSSFFPGYWSLEAGAMTFILGIDDSSYRDMPFYPKDLVDYARSVGSPPGRPQPDNSAISRKTAGELCPKSGWWFTPAKANSRRYIQQGIAFPAIEGSDYGSTFWQWSPDQSAPTL
ncbi:protein of unknown function [Pseudomonas libanensis]|uniref:PoNe immunity protein domain-containing protein n=1 Tax=Pseudomonas libanensis TaxID=75588 RepID=UPI00087D4C65|nr:PoNe immunity protein domain-containing protein [Pseudomonas libanensis]SDK83016.1 protein of unknown function [Pseudomonas libanensis]